MINEQITEKNEIISNDEPKISKSNNRKYLIENIASKIFMISAFISVISLLLIIGFVFYKGLTPFLFKGYSFMDFIMATDWLPNSDKFGVTSMIAASVLATLGSLIIGVPIGIFIIWIIWISLYSTKNPIYFKFTKGTKFTCSYISFSNNDATNHNFSFTNSHKSSTCII